MLENLLNTKLKKKLLGIFFTLPDRSFSIFELRQITGTSNQLIQKSLREFAGLQVIAASSRSQKRYFKVNPRFKLYDELLDLIKGSGYDNVEDGVVKLVKKLSNVKLAILSGIFTSQPQVSVDLLLIGEEINRLRVAQILIEIEKIVGEDVNFSVLTREEYEYRKLMNDRFVRDILDHPHLIVTNLLK
ncbi:MAG: hypothetical protein Q8R08_03605 [bacterium]|nr:hypothetical protein [bacterium]